MRMARDFVVMCVNFRLMDFRILVPDVSSSSPEMAAATFEQARVLLLHLEATLSDVHSVRCPHVQLQKTLC